MVMLSDHTSETSAAGWVRHRGPVTSVVIVPQSRVAVTAGYDSAVGLFDLDTGKATLLGYHEHLVNRVVVNEAGTKAASCSSDYSICIWDLVSRTLERRLQGHLDDVEDFTFIDERTGASASRDRQIIIWDLVLGTVLRTLTGHQRDVLAVVAAWGRLYSAGDDKTLRAWDWEAGVQVAAWGPFDCETDTCAIDVERGRAVLGCDDGCIRVFDIASEALVHVIQAHASGIKKVAVSPKSGAILSAAYDQRILMWDPASLENTVSIVRTPSVWERSLAFSPDGTQIVGGSFDGTVLLWSAHSGALERELGTAEEDAGGNACFNDVAVAAPHEVVTVSDDGMIRLGHLSQQASAWLECLAPAQGRILMNAVTCSGSGDLVVCGAHDHTLHMFRRVGSHIVDEVVVSLQQGPINSVRVAADADGDIFAACYSSRIVRVSRQGTIRGVIAVHDGAVKSLRLHPNGQLGVSCGADGHLRSWTVQGELVQQYLGHTAIINDVDLSPTGDQLVSVSRDFTVKVFDVGSGRLVHSVPVGRKSLKSVCFWDSHTIFVGDYWGGVIRVDLRSQSVDRARVAANGISALSRCGDGLVVASYDGSLYLVTPRLAVANTLTAMRQKVAVNA